MSVTIFEGVPTLGNILLKAVASISDQEAPKKATELDAVSSVLISCHLYPEGWTPNGTQAKGTARRRLCSKKNRERLNTVQYALGALQYVHDPTAADNATGNEAREMLTEGTKLYIAEGQGIDGETGDFSVGDRIRTHWLELGAQIWSGDATDENGEFFITQEVVYVNNGGPVVGVVAT